MNRSDAVHSAMHAVLLGLAAATALAAASFALRPEEVLAPERVLFLLVAALAGGLAHAQRPAATLAFDLAFLIAAALLFPPAFCVLVGGAMALVSSALSVASRPAARRAIETVGTAAGALTAMAGAAVLAAGLLRGFPAPDGGAGAMLAALAAFGAAVLAQLGLSGFGAVMRGESAARAAFRYLARGLLPDLAALPFGLVLVFNFEGGGRTAFGLLGALCLLAGLLMRRIARERAELARVNLCLERKLEQMREIGGIAREMEATRSPGEVFEALAAGCRRVFRFDYCLFALFDADSREAIVESVLNSSGRPLPPPRSGLRETILRLLDRPAPRLVRDHRRREPADPYEEIFLSPAIRSIMVAPIVIEARPAGLISVQSFLPGAYDEPSLSLLSALAQQCASALQSARNYQRATRDALTGLVLREQFYQRLQDEARRSERYGSPFAVLMLDLDGFKEINDRHGHIAGDRYLQGLGDVIRENLRAADVPCRYGGEEFAVLLPETGAEGARIIAERIRSAVEALEVRENGASLRTTVSIGIAMAGGQSQASGEALVGRADEALYVAKRAGKNRVVSSAA